MRTIVVLFTRDLRIHDNPTLANAVRFADFVVPLYVRDSADYHPLRRTKVLVDSVVDLRDSLLARGGDVLIRHGDRVTQAMQVCRDVKANGIAIMDDYGDRARHWLTALETEGENTGAPVRVFPTSTVARPGTVRPSLGGNHYRVFTPYWRSWSDTSWRKFAATPQRFSLPPGVTVTMPAISAMTSRSEVPLLEAKPQLWAAAKGGWNSLANMRRCAIIQGRMALRDSAHTSTSDVCQLVKWRGMSGPRSDGAATVLAGFLLLSAGGVPETG